MSFIEFKNITKVFGDFAACKNISLSIEKNKIHSIIGENGAGKSTLVKLLAGVESITDGQIFLNKKKYTPRSAQEAYAHKIAFIHQHFVLAQQLTALDNLILSASNNQHCLNIKNSNDVYIKANLLLKRFGWSIDLNRNVENLSVGEQQRLEILKALMQEPDIIIFDEPTAVLTPQESENLMNFILQLKNEGKTIILISHKLNEIKYVSDHISILRQGQLIISLPQIELSIEQMAEHMIGRRIIKTNNALANTPTEKLFKIPNTDVLLYKTEIFGVAGVDGNGQNQFISLVLNQFKKHNLSYGDITEDRLRLSVFNDFNLCEHLLLKHKNLFTPRGFVNTSLLESATTKLIEEWDVRPRDIKKPLSELSGGNQQKFIVARELYNNPDALLAAHPTRGVDLGAQEKIHNSLLEYVARNKSVLLISSDLDEILYLSDRYIILNKQRIYGPFKKNQLSEKEIGLYMTGESERSQTYLAGHL